MHTWSHSGSPPTRGKLPLKGLSEVVTRWSQGGDKLCKMMGAKVVTEWLRLVVVPVQGGDNLLGTPFFVTDYVFQRENERGCQQSGDCDRHRIEQAENRQVLQARLRNLSGYGRNLSEREGIRENVCIQVFGKR